VFLKVVSKGLELSICNSKLTLKAEGGSLFLNLYASKGNASLYTLDYPVLLKLIKKCSL